MLPWGAGFFFKTPGGGTGGAKAFLGPFQRGRHKSHFSLGSKNFLAAPGKWEWDMGHGTRESVGHQAFLEPPPGGGQALMTG